MLGVVICPICNKPVVLETARFNEFGKAVHEDCYVRALKASRTQSVPERPPEAGV